MPSPYSYSRQLRKKTTYRRGPYRSKYAGGIPRIPKARAVISHASVPGSCAHMTPGLGMPQEVKYVESGLLGLAGATAWSYLQNTTLATIAQGSATSARIGRQIRLVGIVYRMTVTSNQGVAGAGAPYTIDFICDKQPNGAIPPLTAAIGSSGSGLYTSADSSALPNVFSQDRFQWLRRVENRNLDSQSVITRQSGFIKCNKLVTYDAAAGAISDIVQNNILITCSTPGVSLGVVGLVRYYYVDA